MKRLLLAFLLISGSLSGQTIQIIDAETKTPVPFVRVSPIPGNPLLGDIDGYFVLPAGATHIQLKSAEYRDTLINVSGLGATIELQPLSNALDEFVLLPGINPAERIMEAAIANRKRNHPMGDESFTYDSYSKCIFTMNPDALATIPDTTTDTNLIRIRNRFGKQHFFMMESTAKKSFEPPYREKEVITAYKVSGFTDSAFSTFANKLQSFHFYENQFNLMGKSYINPLAFGSIRRYLFILEDTTIVETDTTFTIRFQPRKDKNFDGMKGWLYINTNGFALEKVIAEPAAALGSVQPKIIQEYVLIDGKKWFPAKLSTEAVFPAFRLDSALTDGYLVGKGSTYIENTVLGADVSKQRFNAVIVETTIDAGEKDSTHWQGNRKYELTDKKKTTYKMMDSVSKVKHFDQRLMLYRALADGKISLGYVQLDMRRLISYRQYEGYRFGAGLETSQKLWKRAVIGGYFGYGTRDKAWKYGGYASCLIVPKYFVEVRGAFQEDLIERGGYEFLSHEKGFSLAALSRHFYVANMERQRKMELTLSGYFTPRIKLMAIASYQRIRLTQGYEYARMGDNAASPEMLLSEAAAFDVAEVGLEGVWTIREKLMYLGTKRVSLGSKWPKISAKVTRGISGIGQSSLDYTRINLEIQQDIPVRGAGKFFYLVSGGATAGDVPLYLMHAGPGTGGKNWNISVMNSFETIRPSAFYNRQQAAVFTRFFFTPLKTKLTWTKPQLVLHHAIGTGSYENQQQHVVPTNPNGSFRTMSKGYYEAGILLDKLLISQFLGLGIGGFYNYGYYSDADWKKNITIKMGISFAIN